MKSRPKFSTKRRASRPSQRSTAATPKIRLPETDEGTVVFHTDPLIIKNHYEIDYIHSYAEDSPFFVGLSQGKLMGSECSGCRYRFATPRAYCMQCGAPTKWIELPLEGRIHTWTTCYYGSEAFLKETPFHLILVEFDGVDTLFLARLVGPSQEEIKIGMKVRAQFLRNSKFKPTDVYFVPA
ncbi:MAG TPA: Zn-ribbon domain-containing OB-fold protein [Terriglobia bacterium]|nr:Zn-ribbon domain-containing OB-fold protein [Terriglobia bacterium]